MSHCVFSIMIYHKRKYLILTDQPQVVLSYLKGKQTSLMQLVRERGPLANRVFSICLLKKHTLLHKFVVRMYLDMLIYRKNLSSKLATILLEMITIFEFYTHSSKNA